MLYIFGYKDEKKIHISETEKKEPLRLCEKDK